MIKVRILWELNYLLFQATFNQYDEVARFHNIQMHNQISCLTEKVRALELAKVHHRKQQAIAMAALAAEKLNSQKQMNEFQSDSNISASSSKIDSKPPLHHQKQLAFPVGKRLLLKVTTVAMSILTRL